MQDQQFLGIPCFRTTRSVFVVHGVGSYHGRTAGGQDVVYQAQISEGETLYGNGPLRVEVENTETYYHGPMGTHGTTGSTCDPASAGTPVPAEFRIFAADHVYRVDETGSQVPCKGQGSFARGSMSAEINWRAEWTLAEECVVVGNQAGTPGSGAATAGTVHTHHGVHEPCGGDCVDNIRIDYAQYLPVQGPFMALTGPNFSATGEDVTVTARVTDDGNAVSNAPVTFSVVGPAPSTPPGGAALTGGDGRAALTFTASVVGDYTVTASTTYDGEFLSATHTVQFVPREFTVRLAGPVKAQTEQEVKVTATVTDGGDPVRAAIVDFAVTGPGQATPTSGTATTSINGQASFSFVADRAGDYTVTASTPHGLERVSASHVVEIEISTFYRQGVIAFPQAEKDAASAVIDPAGRYAYFGTSGNQVVKVDLATFERVGAITGAAAPAVIDPAGRYAYFGGGGGVVKVDLNTFQVVDAVTLDLAGNRLQSAVIDPAGAYAYFGTSDGPNSMSGRVFKVDLSNFRPVRAITLESGENSLYSAVIDPVGQYAYFGARGEGSSPGRVVRVDLATFQRVGTVTLEGSAENWLTSAVIDPAGDSAYFGTRSNPGRVVKIDLGAFKRVDAIALDSTNFEWNLSTAVIDPSGDFAYFGTQNSLTNAPEWIIQVDLDPFARAHTVRLADDEEAPISGIMAPDGSHAYFGTTFKAGNILGEDKLTKVVKLALSRPPAAWLVAGDDTYPPIPYATPLTVAAPGVLANDVDTEDGDPLTAHLERKPTGGSVALNRDGSFTYTPNEGYSGTDTFTYLASDGMDYSAPATVSIEVAPSPEGVRGSAYGYFSNISLFGGPYGTRGPDPSVSLPEEGSATPVSASASSGSAVYGPATIFSSGPLSVSTQGTVASGSVTGSTDIDTINTSGDEVFTADGTTSTCTATGSGVGGSTTITNGTLRTSEGDPNVEGDEVVVNIPTNPEPNTVYQGQIETVGDHFEYIFNEQVINPDDSITVYAAHLRLLGPTAIGDLYIGKAECGITLGAAGGNTAPTAADDAYATDYATALAVPTPGVLANDDDPDGDVLVATSPSDPANGSVVLSPDGSFTYTPAPGFSGTDAFTYTADDSNGGTATATVSITVAAAKAKAVADFDGDADTDISVFRPSSGAWFIQGRATTYHGRDGDAAVPADYDGDGDADIAVFRPSSGGWFVQASPTVYHGRSGDLPVPADYDGDGDADIAVFRPASGGWHIAGQPTVFFGRDGDVPVPADYDGDGDADIAVFRPASGGWHIAGQPAVFFGRNGDVPVPGHYAGAAGAEIAVFRPANGGWYRPGQATVFFGRSGDAPLPLPHAIGQAIG